MNKGKRGKSKSSKAEIRYIAIEKIRGRIPLAVIGLMAVMLVFSFMPAINAEPLEDLEPIVAHVNDSIYYYPYVNGTFGGKVLIDTLGGNPKTNDMVGGLADFDNDGDGVNLNLIAAPEIREPISMKFGISHFEVNITRPEKTKEVENLTQKLEQIQPGWNFSFLLGPTKDPNIAKLSLEDVNVTVYSVPVPIFDEKGELESIETVNIRVASENIAKSEGSVNLASGEFSLQITLSIPILENLGYEPTVVNISETGTFERGTDIFYAKGNFTVSSGPFNGLMGTFSKGEDKYSNVYFLGNSLYFGVKILKSDGSSYKGVKVKGRLTHTDEVGRTYATISAQSTTDSNGKSKLIFSNVPGAWGTKKYIQLIELVEIIPPENNHVKTDFHFWTKRQIIEDVLQKTYDPSGAYIQLVDAGLNLPDRAKYNLHSYAQRDIKLVLLHGMGANHHGVHVYPDEAIPAAWKGWLGRMLQKSLAESGWNAWIYAPDLANGGHRGARNWAVEIADYLTGRVIPDRDSSMPIAIIAHSQGARSAAYLLSRCAGPIPDVCQKEYWSGPDKYDFLYSCTEGGPCYIEGVEGVCVKIGDHTYCRVDAQEYACKVTSNDRDISEDISQSEMESIKNSVDILITLNSPLNGVPAAPNNLGICSQWQSEELCIDLGFKYADAGVFDKVTWGQMVVSLVSGKDWGKCNPPVSWLVWPPGTRHDGWVPSDRDHDYTQNLEHWVDGVIYHYYGDHCHHEFNDGYEVASKVANIIRDYIPKFKVGLEVIDEIDPRILVAVYNFDEGKSNVGQGGFKDVPIYDSSIFRNHGIAKSTGSFEWKNGIAGSAINFNGDDWVEVPDSASLNFGANTDFTLEAWIYIDEYTTFRPPGYIIYKGDTAASESGYGLGVTNDGYVYFKISDTTSVNKFLKGTKKLDLHQWYHIVGTADRDGFQKIYVNGELDTSKDISDIGNIDHTSNLQIGRLCSGWRYFRGIIDEVRIYNRVLTAKHIKDHATIAAAYNFDEGKDNIGATGLNNVMIYDVSAHANDGIAKSTGSFEWTNGIDGSAINFNGDDWVEVPDSTSLKMIDAITVEAWVKNDNINDPWSRIVTKGKHFTNQNCGWMLDFQDVSGGKTAVNFYVEIDGTQDSSGNSGYMIEQSEWYHVVGTFDGNYIKIYVNGEEKNSKYHPGTITEKGGPYNVLIGKSYGWEELLTGTIDGVRIYNRALNAQEIKDHATIAAAYNFDEGKDNIGATGLNNVMIFDVSAHANDGIAKSTGSFEWTNGIDGSAINFNGDDWVEVPDSTSLKMTDAITVEAWVKNDNINDPWSRIVTKGKHFTNQNYGWMLDFQDVSGGKTAVNFYVEIDGTQDSSGNSGYIIEQSKWYHVVGTFDGSYIKIYVNGELKNSKYHPGTITETGGPYNVLIGKSHGWEELLTGTIDEVRIYNRAKVPCACEEALYRGNVSSPEEKINSIRELRDKFLRDKYVNLYYEYNPEIRGILIEEPHLLIDTANLLVKYIPAVNYVTGRDGEDLKIEEKDAKEAISFIENLKKEIWERREEIGINRSSNIIEFLEKFEKQVNASKGKTFSQAFRDSIYARWPVNETEYKNSITQPIDVSKIHYKFTAVDEEWAAKWTNLLLYGQKETKYSIEIYLNETGYVTRVDFGRWGFPITEIPYDLANQSLASLPPGFALDP